MTVRRLDVGDAVLAQLAVRKLKNEIPEDVRARLNTDYLNKFLACESNYFIAALIDAQPVGFALGYRLMRVDRAQDMMLFYEIVVDDGHKKKGVGTSLIDGLKKICREKNIMKMWVLTNKSNLAAMELYRRTGGIEDDTGDEVTFTFYPDFE
jgi:GNAT superfamily N-acetyltransferase